jgi:hypothetical protein
MKAKLVIECSGGVVTAVYSDKDLEVTLVDWDEVSEGDFPVELPVASLLAMPEETRDAIARR